VNDTIFAFSSVDEYLAAAVRDLHEKNGTTTSKKKYQTFKNPRREKNGENNLRWLSEDWNEIAQQGARISRIQRLVFDKRAWPRWGHGGALLFFSFLFI